MLKQIVDVVNEIRKEYPIIGNELDGKIYNMNGNDGTDFDWDMNDRTCEFMVFNEKEMGYISITVNRDSTMNIYVYPDGAWLPIYEFERTYKGDVNKLKNWLYRTFDMNGLWDESIEEHI